MTDTINWQLAPAWAVSHWFNNSGQGYWINREGKPFPSVYRTGTKGGQTEVNPSQCCQNCQSNKMVIIDVKYLKCCTCGYSFVTNSSQ